MNSFNYLLLLFIPIAAGVGVFFINKSFIDKYIVYFKLFGGSFFLGVILIHLLPEVFQQGVKQTGLFIGLGFFMQLLLDGVTGDELHRGVNIERVKGYSYALLVGLSVHAFFEGIPLAETYHLTHAGHMHESYLSGVLLHKIPVIVVLTLFMISSRLSRLNTIIQIVFFALMAPLGMWIGGHINPDSTWSTYILAFVVGSISHIAMHLIISKDVHAFTKGTTWIKIFVLVFGFALVYLIS